jgi:hypothetical protein
MVFLIQVMWVAKTPGKQSRSETYIYLYAKLCRVYYD